MSFMTNTIAFPILALLLLLRCFDILHGLLWRSILLLLVIGSMDLGGIGIGLFDLQKGPQDFLIYIYLFLIRI